MRLGPSTPIVPAGSPSTWYGRHDQRALRQRGHPGLGADGHLQAAVEDVAEEGDDDVLLLEDAEHLADRLDGVEGPGDLRGAADEDMVGLLAVAGAAATRPPARTARRWPRRRWRAAGRAPTRVRDRR